MLKVHFFLRGAEKCQNPATNLTIYCQLEIEGLKRDTPFSTEHRVPLLAWWNYNGITSPNGEWVAPSYYTAENINRCLQKLERTYLDIMEVLHLMNAPEDITYRMLREHYDPSSQKIRDSRKPVQLKKFVDILNELIAQKKRKKMAKNTIKNYTSRKNNILAFLRFSKLMDIQIDKIRYSFIENFEDWMGEQYNEDGEERFCKNYTNKHVTLIRQTLDYAVNKDYLSHMPIGKLNLEYDQPKEPHYLLPEQRQKIIDCKIKSVEVARDIAVFLMFTGFSYIDYEELTSKHLMKEGFKKQRHKTGIWSLPPLLPEAEKIIQKYGSIEKLPRPDNKDINEQLKLLGAFTGLHEETLGYDLSTQDFRDTFCSMMENEAMQEARTIMAMMGHSTMKQMSTYSRMMPSRILHDLKKQKNMFFELKKAS